MTPSRIQQADFVGPLNIIIKDVHEAGGGGGIVLNETWGGRLFPLET